jgi:hypothetical protein
MKFKEILFLPGELGVRQRTDQPFIAVYGVPHFFAGKNDGGKERVPPW